MELPAIKIPEITLPFDIPVLLHPPVDHFIIALPIVVLLLEIINLFAKKRAIGVVSFFLIILTVVAAVAAYFTGSVDGKEAWDLLSQAGQAELKEHKLLGTYLMLASAVVLLFKLLSAMIQRGMMKALFLLILVLFVAGILKQGKEGGDLVYKYGANIKLVKTIDDKLFDCQDDLNDYITEEKEAEEEAAAAKAEEGKKTETQKEETASEEAAPAEATPEVKEETTVETIKEKVEEVKESVEKTAAKIEASTEELVSPAVEVVPVAETPKPEIATH